ncbi:unnamed protein product [Arabis nemorensis]|uniref:Ubiquitin-like protease family profile domain-containing protein n=1 Tax=Arabis nemorensis TaxID=586526 RepID=A0A565AYT7_9BRAS|nr:unnamed protein product [Arabis nemorensis]
MVTQLVLVEAVPALLEVIQVNSTSSSEFGREEENESPREKKISLSPSHARDIHEEEKAEADCIIADDGETELDEKEFEWSDEEEDVKVSNLLKLINEEHNFWCSEFGGGVTKADVVRMIKEAKENNAKAKQKKLDESRSFRGYYWISGEAAEEALGGVLCHKSKRQKIIPPNLVGDYQCDKRLLHRVGEDNFIGLVEGNGDDYLEKFGKLSEKLKGMQILNLGGVSVTGKDYADIAGRYKCLPLKLLGKQCPQVLKESVFFDTKFVLLLLKNFSKFSKLENKEGHNFPKQLLNYFGEDNVSNVDADHIYFPFNLDKNHWIGVCVDCVVSTVYILDSDVALHNDSLISKEVNPIAQLFPYFLKEVGLVHLPKELKSFSVERPKNIPQNGNHADSGVTIVLLLHAHAIGGFEVCSSITADVLPAVTKKLAVMMFEAHYDPL